MVSVQIHACSMLTEVLLHSSVISCYMQHSKKESSNYRAVYTMMCFLVLAIGNHIHLKSITVSR